MFKVERKYKIALLMLATICFNSVFIPFIPFGSGMFLPNICFLFSELPYVRSHYRRLKTTLLKPLMLLIMIAFITALINSPHYHSIRDFIRLIIFELIGKYFVLCYAFLSIDDEEELVPSFNIAFYGIVLLTFFGLLNYVMKSSIFLSWVTTETDVDIGSIRDIYRYISNERFRVQAMFWNPFNYGYICILYLFFFYYGFIKKFVTKNRFYIVTGCCLFGVVTCGCRTNMLCLFIAVIVFILFTFDLKNKLKYFIALVCVCGVIFGSSGFVQDKVKEMLTMFDKNTQFQGSSLEMRKYQYLAVFDYLQGHFLFGRGIGFFNINLGWQDGIKIDSDLQGLEGVLMNLFLERGFIGVCFYLIFYGSLLIFAFRLRKFNRLVSGLIISVLLTYLSFANITGELASVMPTLLITGIGIRILYLQKIKRDALEFSKNKSYIY